MTSCLLVKKNNSVKNKLFKTALKLAGNKGLSQTFVGKILKEYGIQNCRTNQIVVNGYTMILDKDDVMQLSLFPYEPTETNLVKQHVKELDIVVDVGANIGYYTLLLAQLKAQVYSFEPEPHNFELLKKNVELNHFSNVTFYNKAVSNINGKAKLVLADYGTGQHKLGDSKFGTKTIDIEVTTLNLDKIDFAKIDVEGAELLALKGMKVLPFKMIVEFNTENLKEHGSTPDEFFDFVRNYSIKQILTVGHEQQRAPDCPPPWLPPARRALPQPPRRPAHFRLW